MSLISKLTPEQKALVPSYVNKWSNIVLSSAPTGKNKAKEIVDAVYSLVDKPTPQIIFCNSLYTAINKLLLLDTNQEEIENNLTAKIERFVIDQLRKFSGQISLQQSNFIDGAKAIK